MNSISRTRFFKGMEIEENSNSDHSSLADFEEISDHTIHEAVMDWMSNEESAIQKWGHIEDWDTSHVTCMRSLFAECRITADLSRWDTSRVTDMSHMFYYSPVFTSDLSQWNTSRVVNTSMMFSHAVSFDSDLSRWDMSQVTDMSMMFFEAVSFHSDLSRWDTSQVTDMFMMFTNASVFYSDLSRWNLQNVNEKNRTMMLFQTRIQRMWNINDLCISNNHIYYKSARIHDFMNIPIPPYRTRIISMYI
jgi:surface protein